MAIGLAGISIAVTATSMDLGSSDVAAVQGVARVNLVHRQAKLPPGGDWAWDWPTDPLRPGGRLAAEHLLGVLDLPSEYVVPKRLVLTSESYARVAGPVPEENGLLSKLARLLDEA